MKGFWLGMLWHVAVGLEVQVLSLSGRWALTAAVMFFTSYLGARVVQTLALSPDMALGYATGSMIGGLASKVLMDRLKRNSNTPNL